MRDSKRSFVSSSSKSELKQRLVWEIKKNLVKQRLMGLDNNEESLTMDKPTIHCRPKESPTADYDSRSAVSTSAMDRGLEVQANLPQHLPSFLKLMLTSHVSGGFTLALIRKFCLAHLPNHDETVVLVSENGEEYNTKYLAYKNGLSGGWRSFSIAHKLRDGDVLVFQLIEPCKFKVYIVRARRLTEVDGAIPATPINSVKMEDEPEETVRITETARRGHVVLVPPDNQQKNDMGRSVAASDQSRDDTKTSGSDIMDNELDSCLGFKGVKGLEDFKIHVNGLIIDSEIPMPLKTKYYDLCRGQNMFLHHNLIRGLNSKLAAGIISETINIADAIRAAKSSTPSHFESWDKTLKAFEDLGMVVGFLRARIHKLLSLCRESELMIGLKRTERGEAEKEVRALKMKLSDVKMRIVNLDDEIDALEVKNEKLELAFKEVAGARW